MAFRQREGSPNGAFRIGPEIQLPHLDQRDVLFLQKGGLPGVAFQRAFLTRMSGAVRKHSRIGVPERAVDFNHRVEVWQVEINDRTKTACGKSEPKLGLCFHSKLRQNRPNISFQLRNPRNPPFRNGLGYRVRDFQAGCRRAAVVSGRRSNLVLLSHPNSLCPTGFLGNHVGGLNFTPNQAQGTRLVVASPRAEKHFSLDMLSLRWGTGCRCPADTARLRDGLPVLLCSKVVRAFSRTRRLSTVSQPFRVRRVVCSTNGTGSFNHRSLTC